MHCEPVALAAPGSWPSMPGFAASTGGGIVAGHSRLLPPAELYYLHSFELHRAVAPLAARLGARVIYDAHDFYRGIEPR